MAISERAQNALILAGVVAVAAIVASSPYFEKRRDLRTVCDYVMGGPLRNELGSDRPKTLKEGVVAICNDELGLNGEPKEDPSR